MIAKYKTSALRSDKVLPQIIQDQRSSGIYGKKNKSSADNMRRLLHLIWMNRIKLHPVSAISLDAQKAFDRLGWASLFTTLSEFGFGEGFCRWVRVLYSCPEAAVFTNGMISQFFSITRSARQGCSLSPLLFTIFLEPLATLIRAESRIKGVIGGGREHKLFLNADHILVPSWEPASSVSVLLETKRIL